MSVTGGGQRPDAWEDLEAAYLATDDPRGQSGFHGDEAAWRRARVPIVEALDKPGTFLDIGCANGHLLETLVLWAGERGLEIEPFGLEVSAGLARLARERLAHWGDRIFEGDAMRWSPPRRFDFVRTELVYVPENERRSYVRRLLDVYVAPSGRLVVCGYGSAGRNDPAPDVGLILREWGFVIQGEAEALNDRGFPITRAAWIDGPDRRPAGRGIP